MISRPRLAAAVLLPLALVVSGCGGSSGSNPSSSASATADTGSTATSGNSASGSASAAASAPATVNPQLDGVKIEYDGKASPKITLPSTPFSVDTGYRVVKEGDGDELKDGMTAMANYVVMSSKDGKVLESSFDKKTQAPLSLAGGRLLPAIRDSLIGRKVGTQTLAAVSGKEFPAEQRTQMGLGESDAILFFFDITAAHMPLTEATGDAVPPKAGLPTVTMGATPKDPAKISIPKGYVPPKTLVVQPLIQGKGAKVQAKQTVTVSYTGVTVRDPGTPFDYSGKTGAPAQFPIGVKGVIPGWDKAIVGANIGSRLLIIVPPDEGYGKTGRAPAIKGTDTLVFVVDILDAA